MVITGYEHDSMDAVTAARSAERHSIVVGAAFKEGELNDGVGGDTQRDQQLRGPLNLVEIALVLLGPTAEHPIIGQDDTGGDSFMKKTRRLRRSFPVGAGQKHNGVGPPQRARDDEKFVERDDGTAEGDQCRNNPQ